MFLVGVGYSIKFVSMLLKEAKLAGICKLAVTLCSFTVYLSCKYENFYHLWSYGYAFFMGDSNIWVGMLGGSVQFHTQVVISIVHKSDRRFAVSFGQTSLKNGKF